MNKLVALVIAIAISACTTKDSKREVIVESAQSAETSVVEAPAAPAPSPSAVKKLRKPDMLITAEKLLKEYRENQLAADKKVKGKRIGVTGYVSTVTNGIIDGIDVSINSGEEFDVFSVTCNFDKDTPGLDALKKGQVISILGQCDGGTTIGITLSDCDIFIPKKK